jgi:hypothetical protein
MMVLLPVMLLTRHLQQHWRLRTVLQQRQLQLLTPQQRQLQLLTP